MITVINGTKLLLLVGIGLTYLFGLGWLVVGSILNGIIAIKKKDVLLLQKLPLALISGLIINYGIVLCFQSLKTSLIIGGLLSALGIYRFAVYIFRLRIWQISTSTSINKWMGICFVCLLYLSPILAEPLSEWDARSVWFFHAKMIYAAGSIGQSAGWQHPSVAFSQTDYPNLVPALAAQIAYIAGFWNEYIPKASLFFMLVPAIIWLFTFARRAFSFAILLLLIPFSLHSFIWSGMMDGYLALYFSVAMLLLGRYINSLEPADMVSSLCCLIALLYIKNEGLLAAMIGLCLLVPIYFLKKTEPHSAKNIFFVNWKYFLAGLMALLPFVLWSLYKQHWNLSNGLEIASPQSLLRMSSRLYDDSYKLILQGSYQQLESALLLLGLLYFASVARNKSLAVAGAGIPALIAAGIYSLGMMSIYLLTPFDLAWHLASSLSRTMLSANGCIFIGCYYILNALESTQHTQ